MESAQTRVMKSIPIGLLRPSPYQARKIFDETKIEGLSNSIKSHGLLAPILAREVGESFEVIAGQRRVMAAQKAGWEAVDALVFKASDVEAALLALVENLHRVDLNPVEQATAMNRLTKEPFNMTPGQIAEILSIDRSVVVRLISVLGEASPIQHLLAGNRITGYHLRALKPVTDSAKRVELAQQAADQKWSATELRKRVAEIVPPKPSRRNTNAPRNDTAPQAVSLPRALVMLVLDSSPPGLPVLCPGNSSRRPCAGWPRLLSRRINRGTRASSGSPIWTAISSACSTTSLGNCRRSKPRPDSRSVSVRAHLPRETETSACGG